MYVVCILPIEAGLLFVLAHTLYVIHIQVPRIVPATDRLSLRQTCPGLRRTKTSKVCSDDVSQKWHRNAVRAKP